MESWLGFGGVAIVFGLMIYAAVRSTRRDKEAAAAYLASNPEPVVLATVAAGRVDDESAQSATPAFSRPLRVEIPFGQIFWPVVWAQVVLGFLGAILLWLFRSL